MQTQTHVIIGAMIEMFMWGRPREIYINLMTNLQTNFNMVSKATMHMVLHIYCLILSKWIYI